MKAKQVQDAIAEFEKTVALTGSNFVYEAYLAHALAASGQSRQGRADHDGLAPTARSWDFYRQYSLAIILVGLGEKEKAITALNRAGEQDDPNCIWLRVDPRMDRWRTDPRWPAVTSQSDKINQELALSVIEPSRLQNSWVTNYLSTWRPSAAENLFHATLYIQTDGTFLGFPYISG